LSGSLICSPKKFSGPSHELRIKCIYSKITTKLLDKSYFKFTFLSYCILSIKSTKQDPS
jgi:hypothetical protein